MSAQAQAQEADGILTRYECPDNHAVLNFGSGDYYIFCQSCGRKWILHGDGKSTQPEYMLRKDGRSLVGGDPSKTTTFVGVKRRVRSEQKEEPKARSPHPRSLSINSKSAGSLNNSESPDDTG